MLRFTEFLGVEYGPRGILSIAFHPGNVATDMGLGLPDVVHSILIDTLNLAANTVVWLTSSRREWLAGRYVSTNWDMAELEARADEIAKGDKLKVRMVV